MTARKESPPKLTPTKEVVSSCDNINPEYQETNPNMELINPQNIGANIFI
jgi:hypothetical protein